MTADQPVVGPAEPTSATADDDLPPTCLRGLKKQDWVTAEGWVATTAFLPDDRTAKGRADQGKETSIDWEDHDSVLGIALSDLTRAAHGVARLCRDCIKRLPPLESGPALLCERAKEENNPHHGNLVYRRGLSMPSEKMIAAALAIASIRIPRPGV